MNNDGALQGRLHRAERRRAGPGDRRRDGRRRGDRRGHQLRRGARHRTELGDPIEVAALTRAFGTTAPRQYCPIGSVKTNVGHLDRAAGATGLIKTVLSLRARVIPPTLHYTQRRTRRSTSRTARSTSTPSSPWPAPTAGRASPGSTPRHGRHQRPRGRGGGAPSGPRADRPGAPAGRCCRCRPARASAADRRCGDLGEHLEREPDEAGRRRLHVAGRTQDLRAPAGAWWPPPARRRRHPDRTRGPRRWAGWRRHRADRWRSCSPASASSTRDWPASCTGGTGVPRVDRWTSAPAASPRHCPRLPRRPADGRPGGGSTWRALLGRRRRRRPRHRAAAQRRWPSPRCSRWTTRWPAR